MAFKIVGVNEDSEFPTRVEARLSGKFATFDDLSSLDVNITELVNNSTTVNAENISALRSEMLDLNIRETTPYYASQFNLQYNGVHQMVNKSPSNGLWYIPQTTMAAGSSGRSSVVVNRCGFDGRRIDTMVLQDAGHGTNTCIEVEDGEVYIWTAWNRYNSSGDIVAYEIARVKYRSGTVNLLDPEVERFNKFTNKYCNIYVDFYNGYVVIREVDQLDSQDRYVLRTLEDFKAGDNVELGSITVNAGEHLLQGFAVFGPEKFYLLTGEHDTGSSPDPATVWVYDWDTGSIEYSLNVKDVGLDGGVMPEGGKEPEGISFYMDSSSSDVVMFIGMASGNEGKKVKTAYAYSNRISKDVFNGLVYRLNSATASQPEPFTNFLTPTSGTTIETSELVTIGGMGYISVKFRLDQTLQQSIGNVPNIDIAHINDPTFFPLFESVLASASAGPVAHGYIGGSGQITLASLGTSGSVPSGTLLQLAGAYPLNRR